MAGISSVRPRSANELERPRDAYACLRYRSGRHVALGGRQQIGDAAAATADGRLSDGPDEATEASACAAEGVAGEHGVATEIDRIVEVVVEDLVDLRGADTAGQEGSDYGPRAAPYIDVKASARPVQAFLEGGEGADLVHAPDHSATSQGKGIPGSRPWPPEPHRPMYELHPGRQISKGLANRH